MNRRLIACVVFFISVFTLWGFAVHKASTTRFIETDILALLPDNENSNLVRYAEDNITQRFQRNVVILLGHSDVQKSVASANLMRENLLKTNLFSKVETGLHANEMQKMLALYHQHSATLLTSDQRQMLKKGDLSTLRKSMMAKSYGGVSNFGNGPLNQDPLMLSGEAITETLTKDANNYILVGDVPTVSDGDMSYALLRMELAENPFSLTYQKQVLKALDNAQSEVSDVVFIRSGLIFHAAHGADQAKNEISVMGTFSLFGVLLLLTLTFKSIRPFSFSAVTVVGGGACGLAACLLFFDKVHLLTLVFGTSLVGVSIDYSLHFFAHKYEGGEWNGRSALSHIFSGISLGLITSIIGFLSLCLTPFESLQQMAVFSVAGLTFVYGIVVFVYPALFKKFPRAPSLIPFNFSTEILNWWKHYPQDTVARVALISVIGLLAVLPLLKGQDDVRAMQALSPDIVQNDMDVAKLLGAPIATQFFIVSGKNDDDLLKNINDFTVHLDSSSAVEGYKSLVDYIAPADLQMTNVRLTLDFVKRHEDDLRSLFQELSMPESTYNDYISFLQEQAPLSLSSVLHAVADSPIAMHYGGTFEGEKIGFVTLNGIRDVERLTDLAQKSSHVIFVDKVANITATFDHHRVLAVRLIITAYIFIFGFLCFRYGVKQSALILSPSVLASLAAIIALSVISGHYSLFHVLALFLVMGIGVDYSLFLIESQKQKKSNSAAMTAITLSALTTLLSFGLLSGSATAALHDFGLIIVIGIIITYFLSPIVLMNNKGLNR